MGITIFFLLCLSLVVEALTEVIVKSQIARPLRETLSSKSVFLKELLHCGYCTSFWITAPVIILCGKVIPLSGGIVLDTLLTILIVQRISNVIHNVIDKWTDKYYDTRFVNSEKQL